MVILVGSSPPPRFPTLALHSPVLVDFRNKPHGIFRRGSDPTVRHSTQSAVVRILSRSSSPEISFLRFVGVDRIILACPWQELTVKIVV